MIVVDASVIVEILTNDRGRASDVRPVLESEANWAAPEHITIEVVNALRGIWLSRRQDDLAFQKHVTALERLEIDTHADRTLLQRIRELAHNMTAYDAAYVALAEMLGCPLVTLDRKYERVPNLTIEIHTIA